MTKRTPVTHLTSRTRCRRSCSDAGRKNLTDGIIVPKEPTRSPGAPHTCRGEKEGASIKHDIQYPCEGRDFLMRTRTKVRLKGLG